QEPNSAKKQFTQLREQARAARESGNKQVYMQTVLRLAGFLNDRPINIEAAALAFTGVGDNAKALGALQGFADAGQVDDDLLNGASKEFAALENLPQYKSVIGRMKENRAAVEHASAVFDLPDAELLAEDIDYDPQSKTFLITSVLEKKIIRVGLDGKASNFA